MARDIFQSMYLCILDRFSSEALSIQGFRLSKCLYAANSGQGYPVNHKRVARLRQQMGIAAIYAKPQLSQASTGHTIYPYVLRGVKIARVNHVWSTDITYIRLHQGFVYL